MDTQQISFYQAVGRRKEATARVRLHITTADGVTIGGKLLKKGDMTVNGRSIEEYFPGETAKRLYMEPLRTTNSANRFAATIKVVGGGLFGQLGAVVHGLSRALITVEPERFRPILKKKGFLTRDSRAKQRRKAGYAGKARAKKQSPKR